MLAADGARYACTERGPSSLQGPQLLRTALCGAGPGRRSTIAPARSWTSGPCFYTGRPSHGSVWDVCPYLWLWRQWPAHANL